MKRYLKELLILLAVFGGLPFDVASDAQAQTSALRLNGVQYGTSDNTIFITAKGALGDGSHDATTAVQTAVTAACATAPGARLVFPAGNFLITGTITVNCNYLHIEGSGTYATRITFNPASALPLFSVTQGATSTYGFSARNLVFVGGGTQKKTAFDLNDCRACDLQDIEVYSGWTGGTSEGVHIHGREFVTIERARIAADTPIHMSANPNLATIGADHFHFRDVYLVPTVGGGNSAILVDTGVPITNLTMDGHQSWIVDKYGFFLNDTTTTIASANILFQGVRCEQAQDATGYCISMTNAGSSPMQNVSLVDVYTANAQNGLLFTNIKNLSLRNTEITNGTGKTSLSTNTVVDLLLDNVFSQDSGTATLTGMTLMWAMPNPRTLAPLPSFAWYSDSTTAGAKAISLSAVTTLLGAVFSNSDNTSLLPYQLKSSNAWTGANEFFGIWPNGTRKFYIDANGSTWSAGGSYDNTASAGVFLGAFNGNAVQVGKSTTTTTLAGAQAVHRTTVADVPYTTVAGDFIVAYTSLSAGRVVTVQCTTAGREFIIKNESAGAFALTITPASGTCDGAASCATTGAGHAAAVRIYADGTNCNTY